MNILMPVYFKHLRAYITKLISPELTTLMCVLINTQKLVHGIIWVFLGLNADQLPVWDGEIQKGVCVAAELPIGNTMAQVLTRRQAILTLCQAPSQLTIANYFSASVLFFF